MARWLNTKTNTKPIDKHERASTIYLGIQQESRIPDEWNLITKFPASLHDFVFKCVLRMRYERWKKPQSILMRWSGGKVKNVNISCSHGQIPTFQQYSSLNSHNCTNDNSFSIRNRQKIDQYLRITLFSPPKSKRCFFFKIKVQTMLFSSN